ncbi:hypothetical protein D0T84_10635 [Dysgonomonas sp. 521]|uniref:hypothetical protein n=1 Tax=Dysgonomonas sp. 521 TaxID=2302932 RepID=UPI0013D501B1|nr:hypothetical protein [Dysgonomonas sp. 521]NDV95370.1 hypothetical protein [Dysgonomonas sp. 521]
MGKGKSLGSILNEIPAKEQEIDRGKNEAIEFTKRRFRDAKETMEMLKESLLDFSEGINPITVQTMMMLVGDESLQFRFVDAMPVEGQSVNVLEGVDTYNPDTKQIECASCVLQHLTLDIDNISSKDSVERKYKSWQMTANSWQSDSLDADKKYYLYARCRTDMSNNNTFLVSETAIPMKDESNTYYHFLVGILNTEFEGVRNYVPLYGFTEILPGRITTDRVVSGDGESYLDLARNAFRIGDNKSSLSWNTEKDEGEKKLAIRNATFEIKKEDEVVAKIDGESGAAMFGKGSIELRSDGSAAFGNEKNVFNADGSGSLANQNINWSSGGNLNIQGKLIAGEGSKIGGMTVLGDALYGTSATFFDSKDIDLDTVISPIFIIDNFKSRQNFILYGSKEDNNNYVNIQLPNQYHVNHIFNEKEYDFTLRLIVKYNSKSKFVISPSLINLLNPAYYPYIRDNNGNIYKYNNIPEFNNFFKYGYITMEAGDIVELYFNKNTYYIINHRT